LLGSRREDRKKGLGIKKGEETKGEGRGYTNKARKKMMGGH
jgi:hypothetical protein